MGTTGPLIIAALATAGALLLRSPRRRAGSTLLALVLAPALLIVTVWDAPAVVSLRDRPLQLAVLVAGGLIVVALLTRAFVRRPELVALAAALTVPFRIPIAVGSTVSNLLVPLYLVVAAAALAYALPRVFADPDEYDRERSPHPLEWLLAGTLVLYALQTIDSSDVDKAVEQVVFFYVPFALLFAQLVRLHWTRGLLVRVLSILTALALTFAAIGFVEYATRHLLLNPKVIVSNQVESYFRVNSLFFDPNIYGRFLVVVMLGLASAMLFSRGRRVLALTALALFVLWAGLVLTLSQTSFAALLVGLAVLGGLRWSPRGAVAGVGAAVLCGVVLVVAVPGHLGVRVGDEGSANRSTSGRYDLIAGGVRLAEHRPLLGYGSGSFSREYQRAEHGSRERAVSASHTIPVTVAAEQGLVGLALYLALLATALVALLRSAAGSPGRAAVGAAFAAIVVHSWGYAAFLEDPLTWALLAIGLAAALRARSQLDDGSGSPEPRPAES